MKEAYDRDDEFKMFVDKYRKEYGYTVDEALKHSVVRSYFEYYLHDIKKESKK